MDRKLDGLDARKPATKAEKATAEIAELAAASPRPADKALEPVSEQQAAYSRIAQCHTAATRLKEDVVSDLLDALALIAAFAVLVTALRMMHRRFDRG